MGPWSPAVHEYLRHLEAAGFGGAPRVLGVDGDFEVLTYIDGEVAADPHWQPGHEHQLPAYAKTSEALRAAARLVRELHDSAAGFGPRRPDTGSTRIRRCRTRSSATATWVPGTPSTGTACRSRSLISTVRSRPGR